MVTHTSSLALPVASTPGLLESSTGQLKAEYEAQKALFKLQPTATQYMLETQAQKIVEGYLGCQQRIQFSLPQAVVVDSAADGPGEHPIRSDVRRQSTGNLITRLVVRDGRLRLRRILVSLEHGIDPGVAAAARLIRYVAADWMVNKILPAGRSVVYTAPDDGDIPQPLAVSESYMPEWMVWDEKNQLLPTSIGKAEAHMASMQSYLAVLDAAISLAPYMVADPGFQSRRYGMLGQLVNQGRAMAFYETQQMLQRLKQKVAAQELNQGLRLSLPYFDDQALSVKLWSFMVIPAGRVLFVPAFVVLAVHREKAKVARAAQLSSSTRKHLIRVLESLELAFL